MAGSMAKTNHESQIQITLENCPKALTVARIQTVLIKLCEKDLYAYLFRNLKIKCIQNDLPHANRSDEKNTLTLSTQSLEPSESDSLDRTLRHEIAHLVFRNRWKKVLTKLPSWFEEAYAAYSNYEGHQATAHIKWLHSLKSLPDLKTFTHVSPHDPKLRETMLQILFHSLQFKIKFDQLEKNLEKLLSFDQILLDKMKSSDPNHILKMKIDKTIEGLENLHSN